MARRKPALPLARVGKNGQLSLIRRDGTVKRSIAHDVLNHMRKLPEDRIVVGGHGIIRFDRRDQAFSLPETPALESA